MPTASNDGVQIYYETDGASDGPAVVLHHGFMGDHTSWQRRGYVDRLRDRYRLLLIDARGHGRSDKPHGIEAYDMRDRVMDVLAVLQAEGVDRAHFVGYSMGGMVALSSLIYAPQRFLSICAGGASPMYDATRLAEPHEPFEASYRASVTTSPERAERDRSGEYDVAALGACRDAFLRWGGAEQAIRLARLPILVYAGTEDDPHEDASRAPSLNPNVRFLSLPGKDHVGATDAVDEVTPALIETIEAGERGRSG